MLRRLWNWIFASRNEDRTVLHELHWAVRGSNDEILRDLPRLDQTWIDRHSHS